MKTFNHLQVSVFIILLSNFCFSNTKNKYDFRNEELIREIPGLISFTENNGQVYDQQDRARPDVLYSGTTKRMAYHLKRDGISYQLFRVLSWQDEKLASAHSNRKLHQRTKPRIPERTTIYRLDVNWLNANTHARINKGRVLQGYNNYYLASCFKGILNVKSYEEITYQNIYAGVNLRWYQKNGELKYDYMVAAGANYKQIQLEFKGADNISLNSKGELVIKTPLGDIIEEAPLVIQNGKILTAHWRIERRGEWRDQNNSGQMYVVSFDIEHVNPDETLLIDPAVRVWGTYYGASNSTLMSLDTDEGSACSTDGSGNVYLTGLTDAILSSAIATSGSHQSTRNGVLDAFLVKFNSSGVRQWGTFYGGTQDDWANSCATDASGMTYMAGTTRSASLIATSACHQPISGGSNDAFLIKFNPNGQLQWGTFYGGSGSDYGAYCALDPSGNVYMTGSTDSSLIGIATPGSHQPAHGGGFNDGFLVKFSSSGQRLWGTYYGSPMDDYGNSCTADNNGNVYLSGLTNFSGVAAISTSGAHQSSYGGGFTDGYLVKFNSNGVRQWGTYYGGSDDDEGLECTVGASGDVYLVGVTASSMVASSIATPGSHQPTYGGGTNDAFFVKFNSAGTRQWGTYIGGSGNDVGRSCTMDGNGYLYVAGLTDVATGTLIATPGAHQSLFGGGMGDAFLMKMDASGVRQWGTYYGGSNNEIKSCCRIDPSNSIYLCGTTQSSNGNAIATPGSHQPTYGGGFFGGDAYLVKFNDCNIPSPGQPNAINGLTLTCPGTFIYSINPVPAATSYIWNLPGGWTGISTTNTISAATGSTGVMSVAASHSCAAGPAQTLFITVYPTPNITISTTNTLLCAGQTATLLASGANSYTWNPSTINHSIVVSPGVTAVYTVTGTDNNLCVGNAVWTQSVSNCQGINNETESQFFFIIYPNPCSHEFTLKTNEVSEKTSLEVYDALGQLVLTRRLTESETKVDVAEMPKGVYMIRVKEGNSKLMSAKLVIH